MESTCYQAFANENTIVYWAYKLISQENKVLLTISTNKRKFHI